MKLKRNLLLICAIGFSQLLSAQVVTNLVGKPAFDFTLKKLNSDELIALSEIDKSKIVVIEFFATWCGPCIQAIPHMNELSEKFKGQSVEFLYVTYEEDEAKLNRFVEKRSLKPSVAIDKGFLMFKQYEAWAIPQTLIIDKNRIVVVNTHPTKITEEIISNVLNSKPVNLEKNGERTYFEPGGAENFFKNQSKENKIDKQR
jgi:thiol-disulfide isomerase/thioredoxin